VVDSLFLQLIKSLEQKRFLRDITQLFRGGFTFLPFHGGFTFLPVITKSLRQNGFFSRGVEPPSDEKIVLTACWAGTFVELVDTRYE